MRAALICIDKPDHLQTRLDNRAAHLAHIESSGIVEMAGPFLDGDKMAGSLVSSCVSTTMPLLTASPASLASTAMGSTPIPYTTRSAGSASGMVARNCATFIIGPLSEPSAATSASWLASPRPRPPERRDPATRAAMPPTRCPTSTRPAAAAG